MMRAIHVRKTKDIEIEASDKQSTATVKVSNIEYEVRSKKRISACNNYLELTELS
jgi:hypothetical protein